MSETEPRTDGGLTLWVCHGFETGKLQYFQGARRDVGRKDSVCLEASMLAQPHRHSHAAAKIFGIIRARARAYARYCTTKLPLQRHTLPTHNLRVTPHCSPRAL